MVIMCLSYFITAVQRAKSNVEKHYAVVGTTENINMTLG
jgi:hypothetical protein